MRKTTMALAALLGYVSVVTSAFAERPHFFQRFADGRVIVLYQLPCGLAETNKAKFPSQGAIVYGGIDGTPVPPHFFCYRLTPKAHFANVSVPIGGSSRIDVREFMDAGPISTEMRANLQVQLERQRTKR